MDAAASIRVYRVRFRERNTFIGDATEENANLEPFYYIEDKTKTFTVGCIVVGRHISELNSLIDKYATNLALLIVIVTLFGGILILSLFRKLFKSIDKITNYISNINERRDKLSTNVIKPPCRDGAGKVCRSP